MQFARIGGFLGVFALSAIVGAGCTGDTPGVPPECIYPCPSGQEWYACTFNGSSDPAKCHASQMDAQYYCEENRHPHAEATPLNCGGQGDTGGPEDNDTGPGSNWDPGANVTQNPESGAYELDQDFVEALMADGFAPLSIHDSARLYLSDSGYYELERVAPDDLAAAIGLQSGDVLQDINGYGLRSLDAILEAYQALKSESSFVLTIERAGRIVRLSYAIVGT